MSQITERVSKIEWWLIGAMFALLVVAFSSYLAWSADQARRLSDKVDRVVLDQQDMKGRLNLVNYIIVSGNRPITRAGGNDTTAYDYAVGIGR